MNTWPGLLFIISIIIIAGAWTVFIGATVWREAVHYFQQSRKWKEEQRQIEQKKQQMKEWQEQFPIVFYHGQSVIDKYFERDEEIGELVYNNEFGDWVADFNQGGQRMIAIVRSLGNDISSRSIIEMRFIDLDSQMMFKLAWGGR